MSAKDFIDFYELLGLPPNASREDIERAFRTLARQYHPDLNPDPEAQERFRLLVQARETLLDTKRRALYDQQWRHIRGRTFHPAPDQAEEPTIPIPEAPEAPAKTTTPETAPILEQEWYVETLYSRPGPVENRVPQRFYALTRWRPPAPPTREPDRPLFLCLVVDRSTSMQGRSLQILRRILSQVLPTLSHQDIVALIAFDDRAELLVPPRPGNAPLVLQVLMRLRPQGATEFMPPLRMARELLERRPRSTLPWLLFFTDGRAYDQPVVLEWLPTLQKEHILIDAFGLGTEWDEAFLERLATSTGGTVTYIHAYDEGAKALQERLVRLRRAYVFAAFLEWELPPEIQVRTIVRMAPDIGYYPSGHNTIALGPLMPGEWWQILWEWDIVHPLPLHHRIHLRSTIRAHLPDGRVWSHTQDFERPVVTAEDVRSYTPAREVIDAVQRLSWHRLQEKARKALRERRPRKAQHYLQALAHHLTRAGEIQMAETVRQELNVLRDRATLTAEGEKRLEYGTRRLLLPILRRRNAV